MRWFVVVINAGELLMAAHFVEEDLAGIGVVDLEREDALKELE